MKKLFHLGIVALFAITVSSCSKSTNDLVANQKDEPSNALTRGKNSKGLLNGYKPSEAGEWGDSKFFPFVIQPHELMLGDPDNSILHTDGNEYVVFFVLISYNYSEIPAETASLTLYDDMNNEIINMYDLITVENASGYGVKVPEDLSGQEVYFAMVPMSDLVGHMNNTVSLFSDITTAKGTTNAQLTQAFRPMP